MTSLLLLRDLLQDVISDWASETDAEDLALTVFPSIVTNDSSLVIEGPNSLDALTECGTLNMSDPAFGGAPTLAFNGKTFVLTIREDNGEGDGLIYGQHITVISAEHSA